MTGEMVADAQAASRTDDKTGKITYAVELTLNDDGAEIFRRRVNI